MTKQEKDVIAAVTMVSFGTCKCGVAGQLFKTGKCAHCYITECESMIDRLRDELVRQANDLHHLRAILAKGDARIKNSGSHRPERALAPAQPEGWVSVEERLPDDGDMVIVYNGKICTVADYDADPDLDCPWTDRIEGCTRIEEEADVTHWMSLPSPPAPGAREQDAAAQGQVNAGEQDSGSSHYAGSASLQATGESRQAGYNPAPAAPLPEEPPELVTMRKYGGASTRRSSPILAYIDALRRIAQEQAQRAELAEEQMGQWRQAAYCIGEKIDSNGPDGYYSFDPASWAAWCNSRIRFAHTELSKLEAALAAKGGGHDDR